MIDYSLIVRKTIQQKSYEQKQILNIFLKVNKPEMLAKKLREDFQEFPPSFLASFYRKI